MHNLTNRFCSWTGNWENSQNIVKIWANPDSYWDYSKKDTASIYKEIEISNMTEDQTDLCFLSNDQMRKQYAREMWRNIW